MSQRYDIYFAAQLEDGFELTTVRENLGKLFKADAATLDKLFSGKPQLIKKGVDKEAAIKYKAALKKAGAIARIREHADAPTAAAAPSPAPAVDHSAHDDDLPSSADIKSAPAEEPAHTDSGGSMADRVAALAGEPSAQAFDESMSLAPAGSEVLGEEEREVVEELDIDTSAIHVASEFSEPEAPPAEPPPPAPDTDHLSMGEVGEEIPHLTEEVEEIDPDTSHLSMGEAGEDIPHLVEEVEAVDPDTSGIDLAPEGSDVLEEKYRVHEEAQAPSTEHLALED